jgi:hypothetical protein
MSDLRIGNQRVLTEAEVVMWRNLITVLLVASVATFGQYPQYPSQYPNQQPIPQPQAGQGQIQEYPPYAQGQQAPDGEDAAGDQQHGVARISIVQGDVNVKRGDNGELTAAAINTPLLARDHLETSPGSRAEIELDSATMIRLAPNTDIGIPDLTNGRYQAQLGIGTIILRVLRESNVQVEVDTPSVALRPVSAGDYRISVFDNGTSQITVRSGRLEMSGPNGSQNVEAGHSLLVRGDAADPEFQESYELARDQFDDWSATRDNELLSSQSYRYVSQDVSGAQDLDAYGNWVPSQYGDVWQPQTPSADWSPYSTGQWAYEDYYGWTWIDNAPWGWAPYHYGRWFWNGGHGWCWWPGLRGSSHFWSPALVGFFGWGGVGVGLGWVALAPFEAFHPWWGRYGRGGYGYGGYGRGVELGRTYRNASVRGGAMIAGYNGFGGPGHRFSAATRAQLTGVSLIHGSLPVSPSRASFRFSNRQAVANPRLSSAANRQFFSRGQVGRGGAGASFGTARRGFAAAPSTSGNGGWQRFGSPGNTRGTRQGFAAEPGDSGWHSFGRPQSVAPTYYGSRPRSGSSAPSARRYNAAPRYNAPAGRSNVAPHYSAPETRHYSSPSPSFHGGGERGGGSSHSGGGGGGGHSSGGGGHRGR